MMKKQLPIALALVLTVGVVRADQPNHLYMVPNFHPACMGWLAPYSLERNYCLYSYLAHLDRVARDSSYKFAFSEIPHLITMLEYEPERFAEFRQRVQEGRIECVNAFVLEPTISLSGGEALMQQGVQGLRWYRQVLDLQPRFCWMIDTCGWHEQMAQIVASLGLEAFVYCRYNPTSDEIRGPEKAGHREGGSALHWIQSPDGSRMLAINPGPYADSYTREVFKSKTAITPEHLSDVLGQSKAAQSRFPKGAPGLCFGGAEDYSLPFLYDKYPAELIAAWNEASPDFQLRMATLGEYVDAVMPGLRSGEYAIPSVTSGSAIYGWPSFWVNMPVMKQWYRRIEHELQSAEMLATVASLEQPSMPYPSQSLADAWVLMCLNMDRNLLWGAAIDGPYSDDQSWNAWDRFHTIEGRLTEIRKAAWRSSAAQDQHEVVLFNPLNWGRESPFELRLPAGRSLAGGDCQPLDDQGNVLVKMSLPSMGLTSARLREGQAVPPASTALPETIETDHYSVKIDPDHAALVSLKLKPDGRELLGGPANVILAEAESHQHSMPRKKARTLLTSSTQSKAAVSVTAGSLCTVVEARGPFIGGGELRRVMRFYRDSPRIDCVTETNGLPDGTILSVEFPLVDEVTDMRRGIPFGFSRGDCVHGVAGVTGVTQGILPAIRWSDYTFKQGGGLAILDRGVPGRELAGKTAVLLLHNVCESYMKFPVTLMADGRKQAYAYAIVPRAQAWEQANVPRMAWEYNSPVTAAAGYARHEPKSFIETSDNVIVEALRRDGDQIELRLVECLGKAGDAYVKVNLPHTQAAWTNPLGGNPLPLGVREGSYALKVRPQQIVTLRFRTSHEVAPVEALRSFDPLVPPAKLEFMRQARDPKLIGHPPRNE